MRNKIRLGVLILVLLIAQILWDVRIFYVKPDLLLIATVFFGLARGSNSAACFGLIAGLIQDAMSFGPVGLGAFCLALTGFIVGNVREYIYQENAAMQIFINLIASIFFGLAYILILNILTKVYILGMFWKIALPCAIYTAVISPLVFMILSKIDFLRPSV